MFSQTYCTVWEYLLSIGRNWPTARLCIETINPNRRTCKANVWYNNHTCIPMCQIADIWYLLLGPINSHSNLKQETTVTGGRVIPAYKTTPTGDHPYRRPPLQETTPTGDHPYRGPPLQGTTPTGDHPYRRPPLQETTPTGDHPYRRPPLQETTPTGDHPYRRPPLQETTPTGDHPYRRPPLQETTPTGDHPYRRPPLQETTWLIMPRGNIPKNNFPL